MTALHPRSDVLHATAVVINGSGVLLCGEPGIGKSALALELISRGHVLIADDLVELAISDDIKLQAGGASLGQGWLLLRGLGPVQVTALYGPQASVRRHEVHLIVNLLRAAPVAHLGAWHSQALGTVALPALDLDADNPRLALFTELAVAVMGDGADAPAHRELFEDRLHKALEPPSCE